MLFGYSLQAWQVVVFWLWAVTAVTGAVAVAASLGASVISYYISDETQRVADAQTARANATAEQAREGAAKADERAGQANEAAGSANERAARLEVQAAEARERAATMEARVAELNLQIAKIKEPRRAPDHREDEVVEICQRFGKVEFDVTFNSGDTESLYLAQQLERLLTLSGWNQNDWVGGDINLRRENKPLIGLNVEQGLILLFSDDEVIRFNNAATALAKVLNENGVSTMIKTENWKSIAEGGMGASKGRLHIMVGKKAF